MMATMKKKQQHRWSRKTGEQHLLDEDDEDDGHRAPVPTVAFKTSRHDNHSGTGKKFFRPPPTNDSNGFPELPFDTENPPPKNSASTITSPSVRFRDRSSSPPPRPPPRIMRAKTIKARGGSTSADAAHEGCHSSVEESRSHGSHSDAGVTFMSSEDVPFFGAEAGYMHGYGTAIDHDDSITKTVKARGGGGFMKGDLSGDEDDNNEKEDEEYVPRSAKELWMKMRDRIKRGSFMVHSFSSHRSGILQADDDDDAASVQGSIFSGGGGSVAKEDTRRSNTSAVSTKFGDLDLPYEITLAECCGAIILYLLLGVIVSIIVNL